jgi:class 3 adenylate cyclase
MLITGRRLRAGVPLMHELTAAELVDFWADDHTDDPADDRADRHAVHQADDRFASTPDSVNRHSMIPIQPYSATAWQDPADLVPPGPSSPDLTRPVHCAMLAVDIAAFSGRDPETQRHLHAGLYQIVRGACDAAGMPWRICHHEDRGDGILLVAPAGVSPELLDSVAAHLRAGLRLHNKLASAGARIRLRVALHAGYVRRGHDGVQGRDVIHLFRLLDAPQLKARLAAGRDELAVIVSDDLYNDVIRHGPSLIDPSRYQRVTIRTKETCTPAWIWLPGALPPDGRARW